MCFRLSCRFARRGAMTAMAAAMIVAGGTGTPLRMHADTGLRATNTLTFVQKTPTGQQNIDEWDIGAPGGTGMVANLAVAKVLEIQAPGCMEGPCPDTMIVVFQDGSAQTVQNAAYVDQVARADGQHFLVLAGFCEIKYPAGCRIHVYAINLATKNVAPIFNGDQATTKRALCGLPFSYRGVSYTVRVVPTDQYNGVPRLTTGLQTCR